MFNLLLPARVDNTVRGHKFGLVLFGLLVALKVIMNLRAMISPNLAAIGDGIPVDTFPAAAAQAYLSLFALFGLSGLMLCLVGILALVRYRALVPCMFALFLIEFLGRRLLIQLMPMARTAAPSVPIINLVLLAVMLVGFGLSLWRQQERVVEIVK